MHRITSADALSSTAAASAAATSAPDLALPTTVPEFAERAEDYEQGDQDAWDDVPLLQPSHKSKHTFNISAVDPAQRNHQHTSTAWREAVASLRLAAPVTVQAISQFAHILVIMSAVGHIGVDELAAVAVGWTWFNLVRSFCFGLSGAYDTFGSQAFGAGNKVMVLSWAITAIFALLLVNIPVSVGMWYAGDAARVFFQQDANVCQKTATFCRFMIPGLFPWSLVTILMKFLQVQGQMWAPAICTVAAIMVHVPGTLLLVHYLGFAGAGWAVVVMRTAHLSFTIVYLLTLGRRYCRLDQPDPFEPSQEGDEEKGSSRQQGVPQKGDSASSLRAAYTKDTWEGSDQSADSSTEQQPALHHFGHELDAHGHQSAPLHQAEMHDNQGDEVSGENRQDFAQQASKSQELLAEAPMQAQQSQDELSDSDQPDSSDQVSISAQHLPQQPQQQQHVKPLSVQIQQAYSLDKEASAVSLVSADGVLSIKQTVLFSLHPSRFRAFLGLGMPGGLASSVQSAAYEVTTAMAGVLGTIQIDAHTTMLAVSDILFTFLGYGFGVGCTIRVGQLLGSQRPAQAKLAASVTMGLGFSGACVVGINMYLLSNTLGRAFTDDSQVLQTVNRLAPLLALYSAFNGSGSVLAGALKGMGRQSQLMWVGIAGFWFCGVPLGYTLAFPTHFGLSGLWLGSLTGALIVFAANMIMLMRVDWSCEADRAAQKQVKRQMR